MSSLPLSERGLAVFGSSAASPGETIYSLAQEVGRAVARRGLPVITGGYGGVMEAACRGAMEAGGEAIGVTCRIFRGRTPNRFVTTEIEEEDLLSRTGRLFALARGFVVLAGGAGTLGELAMLWAHAAKRLLPGHIVILDPYWFDWARKLGDDGRLARECLDVTLPAAGPEDAVRLALLEGS